MEREQMIKELLRVLDELEARFEQGTVSLREMTAYVEEQKIAHLDGYLRRAGALDYQSPKRFFQAGVDLDDVRQALKAGTTPRGLEGLIGGP